MSPICSQSVWVVPMFQMKYKYEEIIYFSGIINDMAEYVTVIFTIDRHFFFVVSQEAGRGFLGTFCMWSRTILPNSM